MRQGWKHAFGALCVAAAPWCAAPAAAVTVNWTDWTAIGAAGATGSMGGVGVTATATSGSIGGPSQTACGTNYWTQPNLADPAYTGGTVDNAPTACEQVGLYTPVSVTLTFSAAVDRIYLALLSVGQPSLTVTYDFDRAFVLDSDGIGYWSSNVAGGYVLGAGDTLAMNEFHGVLAFDGPLTSLSFSTSPSEYWHAFTVGWASAAEPVPEPGTLALLAGVLLGWLLVQRQRLSAAVRRACGRPSRG